MATLLLAFPNAPAQITASASGYVSDMESAMFPKISDPWTIDNQFHNRLNFKIGLGCKANLAVEMRNRIIYGETVRDMPGYAGMIGSDRGWADLS